ncbi:phage tail tape measure protein [Clostridium beijerinckii]|uniref:phage tail tape measure protein n=2 Tax=Clostridium beijerinckii TaxID=1520 RepID=UPI0009D0D03B|nr:phage tail tape measure protein [Clostridium beijerinckii]MBA8935896.1 TP901 family phage tail tape measure protein [Clostridium beijerinckii]NRU35968.1 TP901 family phage tail tape measure protein [Clostridium beijerinckii]NSB00751.1 TP901 family phage tail tape measure protein [Clostridium beijerinckii]OOM63270.1 chromosome partition protein Smc [Clostridium beijerinckii]CUU45475.1 putative Phage tail tape measure protein, family, core region domain protein [Clostridium beijerinckii]
MSDLEKRITAKMVLDDTGYNASIKGINSSLKQTQSEFKLASEGLKTFGATSDKLKSAQDALSKQFDLQSKKVDTYRQAMEKTNSKMQENITERDKLKASLESANAKYQEAIQLYGKESEQARSAKEAVDQLTTEYSKKEKAIESNAKQIQNYQTNMNKAETEMVKTQGELKKINDELDKSNNKWINASKGLKESSDKLKNFGDKANNVGNGILKLTAPLTAAGIAGAKFSMDFSDGMAKISTVADTTNISLDDLGKGVIDLSNMSGESFETIQDGMYDTISSGVDAGKSVEFLTTAVKAAKGGFTDTATSVDGLTTVLNAYGLKTEEVTNIANQMFIAQNLGKTTFGEMSSSIGNVIPTTAALKVTTSELFSSLATLTANGIKTSEAVTGLKAAYSNIAKPSDDAAKMAEKLGLKFNAAHLQSVGWGKFLEEVKQKTNGNTEELYQLFGSVEAVNTVLTMTSDQGMNLFQQSMEQMTSNTTALDEAFTKVDETAGNKMRKNFNELKNASIQLGDALAPVMAEITNVIGGLTSTLEGMDKEQLKTIADVVMFSTALGGILKVVGGVSSGIGTVMNVASKLSGALATGLGGAVVAAAPYIAVAGAVALAGYGIYKGLTQEVVPSVDLFADKVQYTSQTVQTEYGAMTQNVATNTIKISEATKEAVKSYLDMDESAKSSIQDLYINSQTITGEIATDTKAKFDGMTQSVIQGYEKQKNDSVAKLQELFTQQNTITSTEQTEIMQKATEFYTNKETQTQQYEDQINQIIQNAANNHRTLTSQEVTDIGQLQNQMKENAVKSLSDNEVEAQVILQRMKDYDGRITAEQASEHIQKLNESRDGAIKAANDEYDQTVATIIKQRDEVGSITSEQADKMIADATKQRDDTIQKAQETRDGAVEKIKGMNSDLENSVDTSTGKILTWWDKLKNWWSSWIPSNKTFSYNVSGNASDVDASDADQLTIGEHWTGGVMENSGLTTLHERGYEVYQLKAGTRIYNHDASEDLVLKTAESVANKVASNIAQNSYGGGSPQQIKIEVPVILDGKEIARVSTPYISNNLAFNNNRKGW